MMRERAAQKIQCAPGLMMQRDVLPTPKVSPVSSFPFFLHKCQPTSQSHSSFPTYLISAAISLKTLSNTEGPCQHH